MNIVEYTNELASKLKELRPELEFNINEHVKKNNGLELTGITVCKEGNNVAPVIYTDNFYEQKLNIEDAANEILNIYDKNVCPGFNLDTDKFLDFESVKDMIIAKLVNKDKNAFMLDDVPYAQFGDMIVTFAIVIQNNETGTASAKVTNAMMNSWKINLAQLIKVAYKNTRKLMPLEISTMYNLLVKMVDNNPGLTEEQKEEILSQKPEVDMYVVTNTYKRNGSYFITDREALLKVAKKIKDNKFYILPSSIHEFIVIPINNSAEMNEEQLLNMVKEVNATQVPCDEVLADNVYIFDADMEELRSISGTVIPFIA